MLRPAGGCAGIFFCGCCPHAYAHSCAHVYKHARTRACVHVPIGPRQTPVRSLFHAFRPMRARARSLRACVLPPPRRRVHVPGASPQRTRAAAPERPAAPAARGRTPTPNPRAGAAHSRPRAPARSAALGGRSSRRPRTPTQAHAPPQAAHMARGTGDGRRPDHGQAPPAARAPGRGPPAPRPHPRAPRAQANRPSAREWPQRGAPHARTLKNWTGHTSSASPFCQCAQLRGCTPPAAATRRPFPLPSSCPLAFFQGGGGGGGKFIQG